MDHDGTLDVELDRLLARASTSALTTLDARIDVVQRLRDLRDDTEQTAHPPTRDGGGDNS